MAVTADSMAVHSTSHTQAGSRAQCVHVEGYEASSRRPSLDAAAGLKKPQSPRLFLVAAALMTVALVCTIIACTPSSRTKHDTLEEWQPYDVRRSTGWGKYHKEDNVFANYNLSKDADAPNGLPGDGRDEWAIKPTSFYGSAAQQAQQIMGAAFGNTASKDGSKKAQQAASESASLDSQEIPMPGSSRGNNNKGNEEDATRRIVSTRQAGDGLVMGSDCFLLPQLCPQKLIPPESIASYQAGKAGQAIRAHPAVVGMEDVHHHLPVTISTDVDNGARGRGESIEIDTSADDMFVDGGSRIKQLGKRSKLAAALTRIAKMQKLLEVDSSDSDTSEIDKKLDDTAYDYDLHVGTVNFGDNLNLSDEAGWTPPDT